MDRNHSLANAVGILQCLRQLVEEAATLKLHRTAAAIQAAVEEVERESGADTLVKPLPGRRIVLH